MSQVIIAKGTVNAADLKDDIEEARNLDVSEFLKPENLEHYRQEMAFNELINQNPRVKALVDRLQASEHRIKELNDSLQASQLKMNELNEKMQASENMVSELNDKLKFATSVNNNLGSMLRSETERGKKDKKVAFRKGIAVGFTVSAVIILAVVFILYKNINRLQSHEFVPLPIYEEHNMEIYPTPLFSSQ